MTDDEALDMVEEVAPVSGGQQLAVRVKAALTRAELDLLDIAMLAATDGIARDERQFWATIILERALQVRGYRHAAMIRSIIALASAWRDGLDGDRELVALRHDVAGHFRGRYARRNKGAGNAR